MRYTHTVPDASAAVSVVSSASERSSTLATPPYVPPGEVIPLRVYQRWRREEQERRVQNSAALDFQLVAPSR